MVFLQKVHNTDLHIMIQLLLSQPQWGAPLHHDQLMDLHQIGLAPDGDFQDIQNIDQKSPTRETMWKSENPARAVNIYF